MFENEQYMHRCTIIQIVPFFTHMQVHNKNNIIQKPTFAEWLES